MFVNYHPPTEQRNHSSAVFMPKQISMSQGASGVTFFVEISGTSVSMLIKIPGNKPLSFLQGSMLPLTGRTACKALFVVAFLVKFCRLMALHDLIGESLSEPHIDHDNDPSARNNGIYVSIYLSMFVSFTPSLVQYIDVLTCVIYNCTRLNLQPRSRTMELLMSAVKIINEDR